MPGLIVIAAIVLAIAISQSNKKESTTDALPATDAIQRNRVPSRRPSKRNRKPNGSGVADTTTDKRVIKRTIIEEIDSGNEKTESGGKAESQKSETSTPPPET